LVLALGKWEVQPRRENLMAMRTLERKMTDPIDEDLGRARAALLRSNIYVLRKLQVERDGERLVMRGRVESFYHKQLAQELVRAEVSGADVEVTNSLQVVYTPKPDYQMEAR
jgi:hypothetical protein